MAIYVESNNDTTINLFDKRTIYQGRVINSNSAGYKNLVNFNFAEKHLYGRVDRSFIPITTTLALKQFKDSAAAENSISAINFVVDAFNDLAFQFKRCAANNQIKKDDPYLSNLTVYKAHQDPRKLYDEYLTTYFNSIASEFKNRKIRVKNFDDFIIELKILLESTIREIPFTKPAYIKSRYCPINCSGLVVEIADLDCSNDVEKVKKFVNSSNWQFYVNTCRSYGFMVDRFIPWRLVADIGTYPVASPMLEYASKYGLDSTNKIIGYGYRHAHLSFYNNFTAYLLNLYNRIKLKSFRETKLCNGSTVSTKVYPQTYTMEQLLEIYSDEYFFKLYFGLRFLEEESQFKDYEKEMLMDNCVEIFQYKDTSSALLAFEKILNKTFDYRGSLSYIKEQLEAVSTTSDTSPTTTAGGGY